MSASPETLHLLAHQAQKRARTEPDWWDNPLDTALAAVSATRHPPAFRQEGELALGRLRRWHRDGQARRVSADVTATALAAAAAADFARRDRDLERDAIATVDDLARRSRDAAPVLHLALCAWALDRVATDRARAPWPALRDRFAELTERARGLDTPLALFTRALATTPFDAAALVRGLLAEGPASPGVEDGAVLLWVLTAAIERCSAELPADDTGLRALIDRRSELAARLAQEVDAAAFHSPQVGEFDPAGELDLRPAIFLSPMEALLLDISLASAEPDHAWLRLEEAERMFGKRARSAERRLARRSSMFVALVGAVSGALLAVALSAADLGAGVFLPAGLALGFAFIVGAAALWHRDDASKPSQAIGLFAAAAAPFAAVNAVNQALTDPWFSDAAGMITGGLVSAAAVIAWSFVTMSRAR